MFRTLLQSLSPNGDLCDAEADQIQRTPLLDMMITQITKTSRFNYLHRLEAIKYNTIQIAGCSILAQFPMCVSHCCLSRCQ